MKKNIFFFFARKAQICLALAAVLMGADLASCSKEKHEQDSYTGEIVLMTNKANDTEIDLWFAQGDSPIEEYKGEN